MTRNIVNFAVPTGVPLGVLPSFLHEATHYWSLLLPVGLSLAALELRARRHAIALSTDSDSAEAADSDIALLLDVLRYQVASEFLRPLAEGLALFAEFDATPGLSEVSSLPMMWAYQFFGSNVGYLNPDRAPADDFNAVVRELVSLMRTSVETHRRKANLLVQPLRCAGGGYLPGYLFVKTLWLHAVRTDKRFQDTDLFLSYVCSFFYEDFALCAILLEPEIAEGEAANAIIRHLHGRVSTFLTADFSSDLDVFERTVARRETHDDWRGRARLGIDSALDARGRELMDAAHAELEPMAAIERLKLLKGKVRTEYSLGDLVFLDELFQQFRRGLMRVGGAPAIVRVSETGRVVAFREDIRMFSFPKLDGVSPGEGLGTVDLYVTVARLYEQVHKSPLRVIAIHRGAELVGLGTVPVVEDIGFLRSVVEGATVERAEEGGHVWRALVEDTVKKSWTSAVLDHFQSQLPSLVDAFYLKLALGTCPDRSLDLVQQLMAETGFYAVLEKKAAVVRALASIGLCTSVSTPRTVVEELIAAEGIESRQVIDALHRAHSRYGIPALEDEADVLWSSV